VFGTLYDGNSYCRYGFQGTANTTKLFTNASQLTLKFETYRRKGRQTHFPHLFYNQYSSSLELEAKNLKTAYSGSRCSLVGFLLASDRFFLRNFGKFSHNVRRVMDTYYGEF